MSIRRVVSVASWAFLVFAAMFVGGLYPFSSLPAQGQVDGVSGSITITASPITDLVDGSVVNVHVEAKDTQIYSLTAHTCMPGKVTGDHAFDFAGPFCPNVPIGSGDLAAQVALPGATSADLAVKVGAGHVDWHNGLGFPYSITCGPGTPCDLVIRAEITNSTAYYQIPLCYGSGCPAAAPVPVGATAQQVTSAPTPTTAPPPTTTTAAPPPSAGAAAVPRPAPPRAVPPPRRPEADRRGRRPAVSWHRPPARARCRYPPVPRRAGGGSSSPRRPARWAPHGSRTSSHENAANAARHWEPLDDDAFFEAPPPHLGEATRRRAARGDRGRGGVVRLWWR